MSRAVSKRMRIALLELARTDSLPVLRLKGVRSGLVPRNTADALAAQGLACVFPYGNRSLRVSITDAGRAWREANA